MYATSENHTIHAEWQQHISALFVENEDILIRLINPKGVAGGPISRHYIREDLLEPKLIDQLLGEARQLQRNLYFGVCPRQGENFDNACQIEKIRTLFGDVDKNPKLKGVSPEQGMEILFDECKSKDIVIPSSLVHSGNGYHPYWYLLDEIEIDCFKEPIFKTKDDKYYYMEGKPARRVYCNKNDLKSPTTLKIESIIAGMMELLHGDCVQDVSRILRIPGTTNYKAVDPNETPIQIVQKPVRLLYQDKNLRYPLSAFEHLAKKPESCISGYSYTPSTNGHYHQEKVDFYDIPLKLRLEKAQTWMDRQAGAIAGKGKGAERYCFSLACHLIHGFALSVDDVLPIFLEWGQRDDQRGANGEDWKWTEAELERKLHCASQTKDFKGKPDGFALIDTEETARNLEEDLEQVLKKDPNFFSANGDNVTSAGQSDKKYVPKFKFYSLSELRKLPKPKFLVEGQIIQQSLLSIFGDYETCKSFLAVSLICSHVTGTPLFNVFNVLSPGKVLYICSEGGYFVAKRFKAWEIHYGKEIPEHSVKISTAEHNLLDITETQQILKDANYWLGGMPTHIIVDTLSRNFGEGNEVSPQDMNRYILSLSYLQKHCPGVTITSICHTGHEIKKREALSSKFPGAMDTRILLKVKKDLVYVSCEKQKDFERFDPYVLRRKQIQWEEEGEKVSSLVLTYEGKQVTSETKEQDTDENYKIWQAIIDAIKEEKESPEFSTLKTKVSHKLGKKKEIGRDTFYLKLNFLKELKIISLKDNRYNLIEGWEDIFSFLVANPNENL